MSTCGATAPPAEDLAASVDEDDAGASSSSQPETPTISNCSLEQQAIPQDPPITRKHLVKTTEQKQW